MEDALIICYILTNNIKILNGETVAQRVANNIFDNHFMKCIDNTKNDLEDDWKTYARLAVAKWQIRICPKFLFIYI